ncbi:hypothetical protein [Lentzea sp. HUAS12]|uniref:hypothetical protein n=1 Tax=Lentzea sp. HUAS12 TaxID=2951806 RepID=UPI00209E8825|nr:hypothetical protein [Lentzea sp. HUAS12]USX53912.1 hypothetical protein ND450_07370 [Lentzea sp. HUAS12]
MRTTVPGGFAFFSGSALAAVVVLLLVAVGVRSEPVLSVVALVAVVDLVAVTSRAWAALATVVVCWCLHSGFVLGRLGDLTFTARSGHDALVLGGCALGAVLLVSTLRAASAPLHEDEHDENVPTIPRPRAPHVLTPAS